MKNFKINSLVQGTAVTFFLTTANEEMVSLLQLFSELIEICFVAQFEGKAHIRYEFDYDFQEYIQNEKSSFYDLALKGSRLIVNARARSLIKEIRKYVKNSTE